MFIKFCRGRGGWIGVCGVQKDLHTIRGRVKSLTSIGNIYFFYLAALLYLGKKLPNTSECRKYLDNGQKYPRVLYFSLLSSKCSHAWCSRANNVPMLGAPEPIYFLVDLNVLILKKF